MKHWCRYSWAYIFFLFKCILTSHFGFLQQHSSSAGNTTNSSIGPSESADDDLPSVMTCANYLKLPPYSTKVGVLNLFFLELFAVEAYLRRYSSLLVEESMMQLENF